VEEKIIALQKRKTNLAKEMIVSGNKILEDFDEKDFYLFFD
jgi:SNF2 family DNA or RNA helicase